MPRDIRKPWRGWWNLTGRFLSYGIREVHGRSPGMSFFLDDTRDAWIDLKRREKMQIKAAWIQYMAEVADPEWFDKDVYKRRG